MKAFENHQRKKGETVSHGTAKEVIAGFAVIPITELFSNLRVSQWTVSLRTKVSTGLISKLPII